MNIKKIDGFAKITLANGKEKKLTANQILDLIIENQNLRKGEQLLIKQLTELKQELEESKIKVNEKLLNELLNEA